VELPPLLNHRAQQQEMALALLLLLLLLVPVMALLVLRQAWCLLPLPPAVRQLVP
jgi:hypothetical protein